MIMGFGVTSGGSGATTQNDIVDERTESKPNLSDEELFLPGLPQIHTMSEGEMVEFFTTVLKTRTMIRGVELTLGEGYTFTERQSSVPRSNLLHSMGFADAANVLTMALASGGDNCIGFKATIDVDKEGSIMSRIWVKIADKPVHGPVFNKAGEVELEGDKEFNPKLTVTFKP